MLEKCEQSNNIDKLYEIKKNIPNSTERKRIFIQNKSQKIAKINKNNKYNQKFKV